jgi:hypothetical protein
LVAVAVGSNAIEDADRRRADRDKEEGTQMTESYSPGPSRSGQDSTAQAVREQAANVGQGAAQAGGRVAQTAVDQGKEVVRETSAQARNLVNEATNELSYQASTQQKRAAEGLRALGSELRSMAGSSEQSGVASELVGQAASRAHQVADWLEQRQPGQVLDEVRSFARRRPGAFLAGALVAGVVVGRLTRNLASGGSRDTSTGTRESYYEKATPVVPATGYGVSPVPTVEPVYQEPVYPESVYEETDVVVIPTTPPGGTLPGEVRP